MVKTITLTRPDAGVHWGFGLEGGIDTGMPLSVKSVRPNSPASKNGICPGYRLISIGGDLVHKMTNLNAQQAIIRCSNELKLEFDVSGSTPESGFQETGATNAQTVDMRMAPQSFTPRQYSPTLTMTVNAPNLSPSPSGDAQRPKYRVSEVDTPRPFRAFASSNTETPSHSPVPPMTHDTSSYSQPVKMMTIPHSTTPVQSRGIASDQSNTQNATYPAPPMMHFPEPPKVRTEVVSVPVPVQSKPVCNVCYQPISGNSVHFENRYFCPEHFECNRCGKRLYQQKFGEKDGKFYCEDDFVNLVAPKCAKCGKPLLGEYSQAFGKSFHFECFTCVRCSKTIRGKFYSEDSKNVMCEDDWKKEHTFECASCKNLISEIDPSIEAMGKHFHPDCFRCATCNEILKAGPCAIKNNKPYCTKHARTSNYA